MTYADAATTDYHAGWPFYLPRLAARPTAPTSPVASQRGNVPGPQPCDAPCVGGPGTT